MNTPYNKRIGQERHTKKIQFLKSKIEVAPISGFEISQSEISPKLKPHQRDAVQWAVRGGRRALFESFGLGKTVQQLEFCRIITAHKGGKAMIVVPLGVKQNILEVSTLKSQEETFPNLKVTHRGWFL